MTKENHRHLTANSHIKKHDIIVGNFLGGLAWGLGTVIGATVIVAILVGFLRIFHFLPVIGNVFDQFSSDIQTHSTPPKSR